MVQRQASEKLIDKLSKWLVEDKYMRAGASTTLKEELLTLKYLGSRSPFVREFGQEPRQEDARRGRRAAGGNARRLQAQARSAQGFVRSSCLSEALR